MWLGVKAVAALAGGIVPFGMAYGAAAGASSIHPTVAFIASPLILAGAAQLAMLDLLETGAPAVVIIGTALVINARFMLYSAALTPAFRRWPGWLRILLGHLVTDQASAVSLSYFEDEVDPAKRMRFFAGAGMTLLVSWSIGTTLGLFLGDRLPDGLQVEFAIPLMFLALIIPTLATRPNVLAALVASIVTVLARSAPLNLGLLIGALVGIAVAYVAKRRSEPNGGSR